MVLVGSSLDWSPHRPFAGADPSPAGCVLAGGGQQRRLPDAKNRGAAGHCLPAADIQPLPTTLGWLLIQCPAGSTGFDVSLNSHNTGMPALAAVMARPEAVQAGDERSVAGLRAIASVAGDPSALAVPRIRSGRSRDFVAGVLDRARGFFRQPNCRRAGLAGCCSRLCRDL